MGWVVFAWISGVYIGRTWMYDWALFVRIGSYWAVV